MKKRTLFWLLLPSYWLLTAIAISVIALYAFHSMKSLYFIAMENDIRTRATLLSGQVAPLIEQKSYPELDALCKELGISSETRFTVTLPDGQVVADTHHNPSNMERHDDRQEIHTALAGKVGIHSRYSRTLRQEMMYIAIPLRGEGHHVLCAVRAALPMTAIQKELTAMSWRVISVALLTGALSMIVCILVVRRITTPLRGMDRAARRFAEGDFHHRIPAQHTHELDQLAQSLNSMSDQLNKTLSTISEQRNEQNVVLSSMNEGVLAIDKKERIIHMNRGAGEILEKKHREVKREMIQHAIRHTNLQEFIKALLGSERPISRDLTLIGESEKQIQANGSVLWNNENQPIGALIVLRDVTHIRHLETVRSDFVANVSHELKTPITSIKGFVETLLDDDWNHEPNITRFLEIINQQSSRLNSIIDDLLVLSRLEQKEGTVIKESCTLSPIIESAIQLCQLQAEKKKMALEYRCPEEIEFELNAPLLEQALVNLIINAIKYSDPDKLIQIDAEHDRDQLVIHIQDSGFGMEQKHIDRLFERFYRIDTARSRKLGGTGLGLSIVKHIISAHDGHLHVKSTPGKGSTFTIHIPCKQKLKKPLTKH